ncbi:S-adenosyl-L-methionine-dependent tRNA 4-demethylwyosine synthase [Hypsibius exemplaris]|uniref:S-adenosyl-L-methionine-dependent tRNA 4-demethylwyosine synthase TYW1 n=1 Tax=Hypsibius exemplaris TaxID=2072580 RepID=A0A1W0X3R9_HYPEX|nr:S-adenosyl-L-methionine-dependent tRNA 4-demethylwyosine synthase [Hypsibius exemplaris]
MDSTIVDYLTLFIFTIAVGYFVQKYFKRQQLTASGKNTAQSDGSTRSLAEPHDDDLPHTQEIGGGDHDAVVSGGGNACTSKKSAKIGLVSKASSVCGCAETETVSCCKTSKHQPADGVNDFSKIRIYHGGQSGTAQKFAEDLRSKLERESSVGGPARWGCDLLDLSSWDPEVFMAKLSPEVLHVFLLATWTDGEAPKSAEWFTFWLRDTDEDFRISKTHLKQMKFAVFGLGHSSYGEDNFNKVARTVHRELTSLSAHPVLPLYLGDENVSGSKHGSIRKDFEAWSSALLEKLSSMKSSKSSSGNSSAELDDVSDQEDPESSDLYETTSEEGHSGEGYESDAENVMDLEDLGSVATKLSDAKEAKAKRMQEKNSKIRTRRMKPNGEAVVLKEMVTPELRAALTKQGYKIVGSHSGVKLCRWTKSMLRGRGGCYKHTFYGIESHRCMEATPSLACANKCVFCWRHQTNPVGTEWKWQMDEPEKILTDAIEGHAQMIKQFKGVPGVKPERFVEGLQPKHCALSLVGEPIMYPEINTLIDLLHAKDISTFLVTNAQFPDAIRKLNPITQLYVSVDASSKDSLKKIDRPLFRDFWERFIDSLKALSEKGQRTVYRLTLVKAFNVDEIEAYASLVALGKPDFIEIKGVTYCGDSKGGLTMENVPWHDEVVSFVKQIEEMLPEYEMASEHEHSNCILLANKKFKVDGEWWTWIDYDRFQQLVREHARTNGEKTFTSADYIAKTPSWAVYGCKERGFDPDETRFHRKNKKDISGC